MTKLKLKQVEEKTYKVRAEMNETEKKQTIE